MPTEIAPGLLSWASDIEPNTVQQAARTARSDVITGHVALMPDAHGGIGSTIGSVIPTSDAIIPAAVGVDLGCGMVATETNLSASDLPADLSILLSVIGQRIPAGVGKGHAHASIADNTLSLLGKPATSLTTKQADTASVQFATLGSGNHFVEVCLDERDIVWTVLHSGSRGIGNQLASAHIKVARQVAKAYHIPLEDPDLAYLVQGTQEFDAYITDMLWAQHYAMLSRSQMADQLNKSLFEAVGKGKQKRRLNCHHNFAQRENHGGKDLWITRKGAIKAALGDEGVIPGSMGTKSYIVSGLGNTASYTSCAHGAGRRMSRSQAKRDLTVDSLRTAMGSRTWNADRAEALLDEHPDSYKDVDQVMEDQKDLVTVQHVLHQVLNFKG